VILRGGQQRGLQGPSLDPRTAPIQSMVHGLRGGKLTSGLAFPSDTTDEDEFTEVSSDAREKENEEMYGDMSESFLEEVQRFLDEREGKAVKRKKKKKKKEKSGTAESGQDEDEDDDKDDDDEDEDDVADKIKKLRVTDEDDDDDEDKTGESAEDDEDEDDEDEGSDGRPIKAKEPVNLQKLSTRKMLGLYNPPTEDEDEDEDEEDEDEEEGGKGGGGDSEDSDEESGWPEHSAVDSSEKFGASLTTDEAGFFYRIATKYQAGKKKDDDDDDDDDDVAKKVEKVNKGEIGDDNAKEEDDDDENDDDDEKEDDGDEGGGGSDGDDDEDDSEDGENQKNLLAGRESRPVLNQVLLEKEYNDYQKEKKRSFANWRARLREGDRVQGYVTREEWDELSHEEDIFHSPHNELHFHCKRAGYMMHPRRQSKGGRQCKQCYNRKGLIRKYGIDMCRQCFYDNAHELGWRTYK